MRNSHSQTTIVSSCRPICIQCAIQTDSNDYFKETIVRKKNRWRNSVKKVKNKKKTKKSFLLEIKTNEMK